MPTEHVVTTESRTPTFSPNHAPALMIDPGDVVTFETGDVAYQRLAEGGRSTTSVWRTSIS
jgi:acetamidase/formamidase